MDSVSLLDATVAAVAGVGGDGVDGDGDRWRLSVCHVNHGLSPRADAWERFCRRLCEKRGIPLTVAKAPPAPPSAGEDWARRQRLRAFAELPQSPAILAAHHAGDQAETVLFRLLRGAGVWGMSAMRPVAPLPFFNDDGDGGDGGVRRPPPMILRPWLNIPRERIAAYARARRLRWVEDEDNFNIVRRRNFLRRRVFPLAAGGGFDCAETLPLAARRFADGADLLAALARADEAAAAAQTADGMRGFRAGYFLAAGASRTRNWLHDSLWRRGGGFSERGIAEAARQILNAAAKTGGKNAPSLRLAFGAATLREWRGLLFWDDERPPPADFERALTVSARGRRLDFADELGGALVFSPRRGRGFSPAKTGARLSLRLRRGGESLRPRNRPRRALAYLLRENGVAPWRRARLPLVFAGDALVAVPGVAVAGDYAAGAEETGLECRFEWAQPRC